MTRFVTDFRLAQARESRLAWYFAAAYLLVIVYASLSPFTGWATPGASPFAFLDEPWPRRTPRFDLVINVLAYAPLGLLLTLALIRFIRPSFAVVIALLCGTALSFSLETAQMYLPTRVASTIDLLLNSAGTLLGALVAARTGRLPLWEHARDLRARVFLPGSIADPGIALVGFWFLTQLDPSLPLMSALPMTDALPILGTGFIPPRDFSLTATLAVGMNTLAVSLFVMALMRQRWHALVAMCVLILLAATIKFGAGVVMLRAEARFIWLSSEVVAGIVIGMGLATLLLTSTRRVLVGVGVIALMTSLIGLHLFEDSTQPALALWPFRWNYGQLLNYTGLSRTVAEIWPLAAVVYLMVLRRRLRIGFGGARL
jgi:VanZ family protein